MNLSSKQIAKMIDLSCVRTTSSTRDIDELVDAAKAYGFGQVSVMQCFISYTKNLIKNTNIRLIGNVSSPSGSDSTSIKILQAQEMVKEGCDEIDMMMNIGMRMELGTQRRMSETTMLEQMSTNDAAMPMPKPSRAVAVVAKAGQSPIIRTSSGFSRMMPEVKYCSRDGLRLTARLQAGYRRCRLE